MNTCSWREDLQLGYDDMQRVNEGLLLGDEVLQSRDEGCQLGNEDTYVTRK